MLSPVDVEQRIFLPEEGVFGTGRPVAAVVQPRQHCVICHALEVHEGCLYTRFRKCNKESCIELFPGHIRYEMSTMATAKRPLKLLSKGDCFVSQSTIDMFPKYQ